MSPYSSTEASNVVPLLKEHPVDHELTNMNKTIKAIKAIKAININTIIKTSKTNKNIKTKN